MKRAITEWGMVFTLVLLIATVIVWVGALFIPNFREPIVLAPDLYVRVLNSRLCLFNELSADWKPADEPASRKAISWVRSYIVWMAPGLEYHNRLLSNGRTIWSLEVALVIPICLLIIVLAIFWRIRVGHWSVRGAVNEH